MSVINLPSAAALVPQSTIDTSGIYGLGSAAASPFTGTSAQAQLAGYGGALPTAASLSSFGAGGNGQAYNFGDGTGPQAQPGQGGAMNWLKDGNNLSSVFTGIQALAGAYLGFKNMQLAKDQFGFQKDAFNKNYANQRQTYNTSLEDRIRGRTSDYQGKEQDVQKYLASNQLR